MKISKTSAVVGIIIVLVLAAGAAGALPERAPAAPTAVTAAVASGISYQGRLTSPSGVPLNGTYTMRFVVYDDAVAGTAVWDTNNLNIVVENGLFNVKLGVDQTNFNGEALWLSIIVEGETLSPRQEILPAPYALSLRPGADIVGDSISAADAIVAGYAPATGTALFADANGGTGVFGDSEQSYGVWGSSDNSYGGYFTSEAGHGIVVNTNGNDHYDYGAYVTSEGGYAVYAQSANNMAVRGEAGNISGAAVPLGRVGVAGLGQNRGVHGASDAGLGMYGTSVNSTGVWGNTSRTDQNFGLYTNDNLFSGNINMAGSMMQVMQNNGTEALSPGDVVVFSGINQVETAVNAPMVQVSKVAVADSTAVAGVVYSRFNMDATAFDAAASEAVALDFTPPGDAASGEFVLVVIQGPALVNVQALSGDNIAPGDLLATSSSGGVAGKAATVNMNGVETAVPGTVFGKALEPLDGVQEMIYVYVTLQ